MAVYSWFRESAQFRWASSSTSIVPCVVPAWNASKRAFSWVGVRHPLGVLGLHLAGNTG